MKKQATIALTAFGLTSAFLMPEIAAASGYYHGHQKHSNYSKSKKFRGYHHHGRSRMSRRHHRHFRYRGHHY